MFQSLFSYRPFSPYADFAPLVLRLALGVIFVMHGYAKITGFGAAGVSKMLAGIGFPLPTMFAYILMYGEVITGIAIIVGVCTYFSALFQLIVAFVAGFFVHLPKGFSVSGGGYEFVMLIGAAALALVLTGPGKYSIDALLCREKQP